MASTVSPSAGSVPARLRPEGNLGPAPSLDRFPIVVHGRVPWNPAFPRPYQTHSRLAERHPVLFIERPAFTGRVLPDEIRVRRPRPHLTVAQPVLAGEPGPLREVEGRVRDALRRSGILAEVPPAVHWIYRPDLAGRLALFAEPLAVVDDGVEEDPACEEGSGDAAPAPRADIVFTGGGAPFLERLATHPGVRVAEPGVDFEHFHAGARAALPRDLERIPPPRVGFAGVLDARVDLDLLRRLAAERPGVSLVLLGPVDGVPRERLPRGPNVFAIGPRPYEERPAHLAGLAAGLLPYRSEDERAPFHPPEVLEFLAAGRPVVSTPLPEIARRYAGVVTVAEPARFAEAVDEALSSRRASVAARGAALARAASWPRLVGEMEILVARAVQDRRRARAADPLAETTAS